MNLDTAFATYHDANPHVFKLFRKYALEARSRGFRYYGAKAIMELVRWEISTTTKDVDGFKINNNYTSRYARLLEQVDPSFVGFFRKRELKSERYRMDTAGQGELFGEVE